MLIRRTVFVCLLASVCGTLSARVKTGLDVLVEQDFAPLAGKRVGVITNHTGLTWDHRHIVQVLAATKKLKLTAIFSPEHGYLGVVADGESVASTKDPATGTPVYSLFDNRSNKPTPQMVNNIDARVFDIQDVGARFYTYPTTLNYILEAAGKRKIPVYVLDRPNPVNGVNVEGAAARQEIFFLHRLLPRADPPRHDDWGTGRHVQRRKQIRRRAARDQDGSLEPEDVVRRNGTGVGVAVTGDPEPDGGDSLHGNLSARKHGGVDRARNRYAFEIVGAPRFKGLEVAEYLNSRNIPGVRFMARRFKPVEDVYKGQECDGLDVQLANRDALDTSRLGLELLAATLKFHPGKFTLDHKIMLLMGSDKAAERLKRGETGSEVNDSLLRRTGRFPEDPGEVSALLMARKKAR